MTLKLVDISDMSNIPLQLARVDQIQELKKYKATDLTPIEICTMKKDIEIAYNQLEHFIKYSEKLKKKYNDLWDEHYIKRD